MSAEREQYHGRQLIRRVRVLDTRADGCIYVVALNGPMRGVRYWLWPDELEPHTRTRRERPPLPEGDDTN